MKQAWKTIAAVCALMVMLSMCGTGAFALLMFGSVANSHASYEERIAATERAPWVRRVQANCDVYTYGRGDARANIVNEHNQFISEQVIKDLRGRVDRVSTGPNTFDLKAHVGAMHFQNLNPQSLSGRPNLAAGVASLRNGECIVMSARLVTSASLTPQGKICDLDYYVEWTKVASCPPDA